MKIVSVVGARPEFIQMMSVSRALREHHQEIIVHTGQHYDYRMSQIFFDDLPLPVPDYNLDIRSDSHGKQTGELLERVEDVLLKENPDLVIVRGDTNSTLAAALSAAKLAIPLLHVEAGERSFNRQMPEEINRLVVDCIANRHHCVSQQGLHHLADEGIRESAVFVGDPMIDALNELLPLARDRPMLFPQIGSGGYALVTIHRAANVDEPERLGRLIEAINRAPEPVIFPCHPRTRKAIEATGMNLANHVWLIDPVGYLDMLSLEKGARIIVTDSGGVQREAYALNVPCLTLREETEWVETVKAGWNRLVGDTVSTITEAWKNVQPPREKPEIFGDGTAGLRIARDIERFIRSKC